MPGTLLNQIIQIGDQLDNIARQTDQWFYLQMKTYVFIYQYLHL